MNETGTPSRRLTNPSLFENENDQRSQRSARSQKTKRLIVSRKTSFCWRVKLATFFPALSAKEFIRYSEAVANEAGNSKFAWIGTKVDCWIDCRWCDCREQGML